MSAPAISLPPAVLSIADAWQKLKALTARFNNDLRLLIEADAEQDYPALQGMDMYMGLGTAAKVFHGRIVKLAESEFSPPGARLSVDVDVIARECKAGTAREFDPEVLWRYLFEKYGCEGAGAKIAYREAAGRLRRCFRELAPWSDDKTVRVIGGLPVLTKSTYWDKMMDHYSFSLDEEMGKSLRALGSVAAWSGLFSIADSEVTAAVDAVRTSYHEKNLPAPRTVGGCIHLRFFKAKVEFKIQPELAEQVRLFLTEFPDESAH